MPSKKYTLLINSSPTLVHNDYLDKLFSALYHFSHEVNILSLEMLNYPGIGELIEEYYSHVIISGTSPEDPSVDDIPNLPQLFSWLHETYVPTLGICAGHQIICSIFGGSIIHKLEAVEGLTQLTLRAQDKLFTDLPTDSLELYSIHSDSVTLPESFDLLASSEQCHVHITKHKQKNIYTAQSHPERSQENGTIFIRNFLNIIK